MKCQPGQATTPSTCQQNILKNTNGGSAESTEQEELNNETIFRSRFYFTIFMVYHSSTRNIFCKHGGVCSSHCSKYLEVIWD
jgi:hypothetical protein